MNFDGLGLQQKIKQFLSKVFDLRAGEYHTALLMQANIFLLISTLLIVKPTVNALFLSAFGVERLPEAFILVAVAAVIVTTLYARGLSKSSLRRVMDQTLIISIVVLIAFTGLLYLNYVPGWFLYLFYVWVAIFAVLTSSQFWILANMVYNVREAKRLFGFIGAGAISGGIFGGYLTSLIAPVFGTEVLLLIAALFLALCIPITHVIWKNNVAELNVFRRRKRVHGFEDHPFRLIKKSKHLTYLAAIIGLSVIVAKLVDYQFSDVASSMIEDPDELASFFGFWFSNFNLASLLIQLFLTRRIVGVWGVGSSLLILPAGILMGAVSFLVAPELWTAVLIKSVDGSLKQSVNKSAIELLSLPIPAQVKNKTKTFIDVVIDSMATGVAGLILIFIVRGANLSSQEVSIAIMVLIAFWGYVAYLVRTEYIKLFRSKVAKASEKPEKEAQSLAPTGSVIHIIRNVLATGTDSQLIYMLNKTLEITDNRLFQSFESLLDHTSPRVRALALDNLDMYKKDLSQIVEPLIFDQDPGVSLAAFQYLFERSEDNVQKLLHAYLNHQNETIADNALLCLALETRDNAALRNIFYLEKRIEKRLAEITRAPHADGDEILHLLDVMGAANIPRFHPDLEGFLDHKNESIVARAISNAGRTCDPVFIPRLVEFLADKRYREIAKSGLVNYGSPIIDELVARINNQKLPGQITRFLPGVIESFHSQKAVDALFELQAYPDVTLSLEALRSLNRLRVTDSELVFDNHVIVTRILATGRIYQNTLTAMQTQIIISFRRRDKTLESAAEREDARRSLIDLLERRLDNDLEQIFRLLGLKYPFDDVFNAYTGLKSSVDEMRINAIEYLDNLLEVNLKRILIPIMETAIIDGDEDALRQGQMALPSESECISMLMEGNDQRIKLAVLHLVGELDDTSYLPLLEKYLKSEDIKIRTFSQKAYNKIKG